MNAAVPQQRISAVLAQVATVISLSSSSLGLMRLDKRASVRSDAAHNAKQGTGKTSASRMAGAEDRVKQINEVAAEARAILNGITTEYDGDRLLANSLMHQWLASWRPLKTKYQALVAAFVADAPALIAEAELNKGGYDVETPTLEEIEKAFNLDFVMKQIPDSSTYAGAGMTAEINAEMQRRFEAATAAAYQNATKDALQRVAEPLDKLAAGSMSASRIKPTASRTRAACSATRSSAMCRISARCSARST